MRPIINVDSLGKQYRLGEHKELYGSLRESMSASARRVFRRPSRGAEDRTIWALRHVTFDVYPGEVVGIIGRNGAGKSTLLKLLSRITEPTEGSAAIYGRVGSLLEVGTGFHQELTGRENIYLNGAILGMKRREIERKFGEIAEFAEVEKFIDTPVKRYSTGMYLRLAFSVAAHLDPEILLVDEVLSVGDVAFQRKCLGKMGEVASHGRTVLFVSHNIGAIARICPKAILIRDGEIEAFDEVDRVIRRYLDVGVTSDGTRAFEPQRTKDASFLRASLLAPDGETSTSFDARSGLIVELEYEVVRPVPRGLLGVRISTSDGAPIFTTHHVDGLDPAAPEAAGLFPGRYRARFAVPGDFLKPGSYVASIGVVDALMRPIDLHEDALCFDINDTFTELHGNRPGLVNVNLPWDVELENELAGEPS